MPLVAFTGLEGLTGFADFAALAGLVTFASFETLAGLVGLAGFKTLAGLAVFLRAEERVVKLALPPHYEEAIVTHI